MFRNLKNDDEGFINEGLEVNESGIEDSPMASIGNYEETSHTKIEISRSHYNQESLFREMVYKKPPKKSCEYFLFISHQKDKKINFA